MVNILVVEDNKKKREEIIEVLSQFGEMLSIETVRSVVSCIGKLAKKRYEIVILDIQFPTFDDSTEIDPEAGKKITEEINRGKVIQRPSRIIFLSAYKENYSEELVHGSGTTISYSQESEEWKKTLINEVQKVVDGELKNYRCYEYDVAFVTTTPIEHEMLKKLADNWEEHHYPGDSVHFQKAIWERNGEKYKVISCKLNQMGMSAAATMTTKLIYEFTPKYIVMTGILGGVEKELSLGDIVVATKVWDYCSGKYDVSEKEVKSEEEVWKCFSPTANSLEADAHVINMEATDYTEVLNKIHCDFFPPQVSIPPKAFWGSVACGSSVIKNNSLIQNQVIDKDRKTLGIDMESYGLFYAVKNAIVPVPKALCVKSVSDFADMGKSDEYQKYAATTSSQFAKELVLRLLEKEKCE